MYLVAKSRFVSRYAVRVGNNVHQTDLAQGLRMVEAHPMSNSSPAVMRSEEEPVVPELLHHVQLVLCHRGNE
jgi:hypothetical protein